MGLFDQVKGVAKNAANNAASNVQNSIERKGGQMARSVDMASAFSPTRKMGVIEIDTTNRIMKVVGGIRKQKGAGSKALRASAAVMTMGASMLATRKMGNVSKSNGYLLFDEIRGYEVMQNDMVVSNYASQTTAVGAATEIAGMGIASGRRRTRAQSVTTSAIKSLVIHIESTSLDTPDLFAVFVDESTPTNRVATAEMDCKQAASTLDMILEQRG